MKAMRAFLPLWLALALVLTPVTPLFADIPISNTLSGGGENEGGEGGSNPFTLLKGMEPIKDLVSGSVWVMAQGLDNRAFVSAPEHIVDPFQMSGVQSPLASSRARRHYRGRHREASARVPLVCVDATRRRAELRRDCRDAQPPTRHRQDLHPPSPQRTSDPASRRPGRVT